MNWDEFGWPVVIAASLMLAMSGFLLWLGRRRSLELARTLDVRQVQLRDMEQRFRLIFEASPTAMLMLNGAGQVVLSNAQASSVFGYGGHELLGMEFDALLPQRFRWPQVGGQPQRGPWDTRDLGEGGELQGLRKDGSEVPIVLGLRTIQAPGGEFVLACVTDVSERLASARELALQREELAHLSRVGMLGELSGSMAHELSQPLAAILSNAQAAQQFLAREPADLDEVRASLADIVADDKRAGDVIRQLRALLRKQVADHRELDLNELITDGLRLARSDMLSRNANITVKLAPHVPPVRGDRVQLQQVFINLLLNAGDAMRECDPPHELEIRSRVTETGWVEVSLTDNGTGIPAGELERIFEPFVTTKADGVGLGLAVCRSIVNAHNGRLWAEHNPGPGSTLRFALPARPPVRE